MPVEILKLTLGPLQTNCYILGDTDTHDAIIIDPVDQAPLILKTINERDWTVRHILATHGHFDHIMASAALKETTGAPFAIHALDLPIVREMPQRVRAWISIDVPPAAEPDVFLNEGDTITAGALSLDVLFTPGHSPGHVSFVLRDHQIVFSGDVLFQGGIGRTDLPGGNYAALMESIIHKLMPLGDAFHVAPGHMGNTTIRYERANNPYIRDFLDQHDD